MTDRRGSYKEMVAFDIEILDKKPSPNVVTAAAVYDGKGLNKYFVLKTSVTQDASEDEVLKFLMHPLRSVHSTECNIM